MIKNSTIKLTCIRLRSVLKKMLRKTCFLPLILLFPAAIQAADLAAALGCNPMGEKEQSAFILLYKTSNDTQSYSKICKSELGSRKIEPMTCSEHIEADASSIRVRSRESRLSDVFISIARQELTARINNDIFECEQTNDPKLVEDYIIKAKQQQLNKNLI
jgi:hypothetical protein